MKTRLSLSLLLLATLGSTSCKKDPEEPVDEKLYLKSRTFKAENRVFTRDGEITSASIKDKAVERTGLGIIVYLNIVPNSSAVSFPTPQALLWNADSFNYERNNDQLILKDGRSRVLATDDNIALVAPFYKYGTIVASETPGYLNYERKFVAYGNEQELKISMLNIALIKSDETTGKRKHNVIVLTNNEFNPQSISSLGARDTLAIREYTENYQRGK